ncbi:ribokinase [Raineyella antarctica]|uniref:Ribokinase n=1 Tax=Raineyella antarctica TaxID=1577474 RepID=A0A1G6GIJ4_9ACTN|nr:ribokinase [Raineyella antarctica]SDB81827.1 ribokinase [Raineyella antarctica]
MSPATITVVGSINADLMITVDRHPLPGETVPGSGGTISPGGKGANQAVAAALLGADVRMVGAVGEDAYAEPATTYLRRVGVDLAHVHAVEGPTGLAVVTVDAHGENAIIVIAGANAAVDAAAVEAAREVIASSAVVVLQGEIPRDGIEAAARSARGRLVVNLAPAVAVDPEVLRRADPLVVNEHEATYAYALLAPGAESPDPRDAAGQDALVEAIHAAGVASVVMTVGADGAVLTDGSGLRRVPSPRVEVVDSTGAGDAFVGALATGLAAGLDLDDAAAHAARVGAYACTGPGAQPSYPTELDQLPS